MTSSSRFPRTNQSRGVVESSRPSRVGPHQRAYGGFGLFLDFGFQCRRRDARQRIPSIFEACELKSRGSPSRILHRVLRPVAEKGIQT
jgi:hypothetical protein